VTCEVKEFFKDYEDRLQTNNFSYAKIKLMKEFAYHQWSGADIRRHFGVDTKEGLSSKEALLRLQKYGANSLEKEKESSVWVILGRQFTNFFIILLVIAAIISILTEGMSSGIIFIVIIVLNVGIGFFQEHKAERSLSLLKKSIISEAKVIRDGKIATIDSEKLVPGDVVVVSEGDKVPADLRIIEGNSLRMNESALTGEAMLISKHPEVLPLDTILAERRNMAYMGTSAVAGSAMGVVVGTGELTEIGKIAKLIQTSEEKTPLEKKILFVGQIISGVAIAIALAVFALGLMQGWNLYELVAYVIALIVAAVPESLPTVVTLTLAIGVINMVKKNAIVRRMGVVEALGSVNIILTDKTGTITKNNLVISKYGFIKNGESVIYDSNLPHSSSDKNLLLFAMICSDVKGKKHDEMTGDPLEVAIAQKLLEESHDTFVRSSKFERITGSPFDSGKKYMMVDGNLGEQRYIVMKGAVESIIPFCKLAAADKKLLHEMNLEMSESGMKNIAVCAKKITGKNLGTMKNLEFLGVLAFSDEPVPEVKGAFADTIKAGIRPIILTGDHPSTAKYISEAVGLPAIDDEIISGLEISSMSDKEIIDRLKKVKIFARCTPSDKIRIVGLFEQAGYTVAVTGDGVNDAPALKAATVGIAMGIRGNDVAKEAADIVLSDDNFRTIVHAITYGRQIYDNVKHALTFLFAGNFIEILLIAIAFLAALPEPLTTIQILWINLITDSLPAIALSFEKPGKNLLAEGPRIDDKIDLARAMRFSLFVGMFGLCVMFLLYLSGLHHSIAHARTLVFASVVLSQMALVMSVRSKKRVWEDFRGFFENAYLNAAVLISIFIQIIAFVPYTRSFFGTAPLGFTDWLSVIATIIIVFFGSEIIRHYQDQHYLKLKLRNKKIALVDEKTGKMIAGTSLVRSK